MQKRIVIGVVTISIAILVIVLFMSGPRKGTVEYHIREYQRAEREVWGNTWRERVASKWHQLTRPNQQRYRDMSKLNHPEERMEKHEQALIALGYWEFREFYLTNISSKKAEKELRALPGELPKDPTVELWHTDVPETKKIGIRARRIDMPKWEKMVRQVDVP